MQNEELRRDLYLRIHQIDIDIQRLKILRTELDKEYIKLGAKSETTEKVVHVFEPEIEAKSKYGFPVKAGPTR